MTSRIRGLLSIVVFAAGLIAAVWSGIATYRALGIYGGPVATGFHREWNPRAQRYELIHETTTQGGVLIRSVFADDLRQVVKTEMSGGSIASPLTFEAEAAGSPQRVGFSSNNDAVIDSWSSTDPKTGERRVEMSTRRNGRIDRWERYVKGALVRVDLDTDGNGKPDRWQIYEAGILIDTFVDANEDGQADDPPSL